ncbi:nucleotidyltransferase domain-containing protein [candidate division KSB1 bacterium]|nr:MAG: nucleotidyltransferase domain-containing protein [candidate division KSB1 bacterium]MBC6952292.1 nucleotidyltransferase domain-containing protein [candidate division KSB1 bacterium]MCE7942239.1 nucleotidyltransferase domain-containing protein [Chlorobi bacterium CHB1]MDL1874340.1 nucleotidyltransferase domain-containing protein [Cytophagia bacterium CHB2]
MAVAANMTDKIQRLIQLTNPSLRLEAVYLFGSSARGTTHAWSDIDLAIVSPDFSGDSFEDSKRLIPYILQVDSGIEAHPFRPEDFSTDNPFVKEIVDTGLRIL